MRKLLRSARRERGSSLIEMMIAMLVLAVGLIGVLLLAYLAICSNSRSKTDSTSTALAEMVIGQISALPVGGGVTSVTITDCAGNSNTINATGTTSGTGADLTSSGNIDFTQSFSSVSSGYAMKYTICGVSSGMQSVYDVRWNVQQLPSGNGEYVVVGAQNDATNASNVLRLAPPVILRTVVGNDGT